MNDLQVFNYNGAQVRTVEKDGDVWFVAKDVCDVLGLANGRKALRGLEDDELTLLRVTSGGQMREMNGVNESGLYNLIFKSVKKEAKKFRRWVTHEVLPQIRRHGMYMSDKVADAFKSDPEKFNALMANYLAEKEENKKLREQIAIDRAFTVVGKIIVNQLEGCISIKDASELWAQRGIPIGPYRLFKMCRAKGWLNNRKGKNWNKPTHKAITQGLLVLELVPGSSIKFDTALTPDGFMALNNELWAANYPLDYLIATTEDEEVS